LSAELATRAQQSAMPVIGLISGGSPESFAPALAAFREGLKQFGFVEGQNVAIEYRWARGQLRSTSRVGGGGRG
jgi:putative tryptophan/tyrosine transport system substrate-binding protein